MKKILLLAAVAAPLFSAMAQTTNEPSEGTTTAPTTPVQGEAVLKYELPKGTFFSGTNALLPPAVKLEWVNTSYYFGEGLIDDATFQWLLPVSDKEFTTIGSDTNLNAPASLAMPGVNIEPATVPVLSAPGTTKEKYSFTGTVYYGQGTTDMTSFKTYTGIEPGTCTPFALGNTAANSLWSGLYPDVNNINVTGFAQKIDYPGTPYLLESITVPGADKATFTLSVFKAPEEEGTMPTDLIFSAVVSDGTAEVAATISSDIIVTIDEFAASEEFQPNVAVAEVSEGVPTPANQGLYAILTGMASNGNQTNVLAEYDEVIDNGMPVALDLDLKVSYSFFVPKTDLGTDESVADEDNIVVSFDGIVSMAQYLCVTNATDPVKNITVTLPDGNNLPSWLSATVERATVTVTDENNQEQEQECDQAVIITFAKTTTSGGTTPVVVNFPNGSFNGFTVTTEGFTGIDTVESEAAVVAREYYDIAGRRLNRAPTSGFYIEKAIKADGSVKSISRIR